MRRKERKMNLTSNLKKTILMSSLVTESLSRMNTIAKTLLNLKILRIKKSRIQETKKVKLRKLWL